MAEGLANQLIRNHVPFEVAFSSAGSSAVDGAPASRHAVDVAREGGVDLTSHRSRHLNATMVRDADLIVTMGEKHRRTVGVIEPAALGYTRRLTDFCEEYDGDIDDPIGGGPETYAKTFEMIRRCVEHLGVAIASNGFDGWRGHDDTERTP